MTYLKTEFNAVGPFIYKGRGDFGGYCFVADGYDVNDFIHFNQGWSGSYNGFFQIDALNPSGVGTGDGSYTSFQEIIIGIEPPISGQSFTMKLYNYVTPSAGTINYNQAFTVTTNITIAATNSFTGDFCAAIFDNSNIL